MVENRVEKRAEKFEERLLRSAEELQKRLQESTDGTTSLGASPFGSTKRELTRVLTDSQKRLQESTNEFKTEMRALFFATALVSNNKSLQAVEPPKVPSGTLV
ncbi:MAG: hypothetical protein MHM6MM_003002 [Cercozoa sp. M6MM]